MSRGFDARVRYDACFAQKFSLPVWNYPLEIVAHPYRRPIAIAFCCKTVGHCVCISGSVAEGITNYCYARVWSSQAHHRTKDDVVELMGRCMFRPCMYFM